VIGVFRVQNLGGKGDWIRSVIGVLRVQNLGGKGRLDTLSDRGVAGSELGR